jgi:drug/metabolite transporter (DMT)-like permease
LSTVGLFYTAAIWGSTFFIVKKSLLNIDPIMLVGYRFILAAVLLGLILRFRKRVILSHLKEGAILGFFIWLLYLTQTIGLSITSAANSGLITGLFVAFVPIFSIIGLKKAPSATGLLAIIISLVGLWMLTGGIGQMNAGDFLTLLAAMAYAIHILLADRFIRRGLDPYVLNFHQFLFVGTASLLCGAALDTPFSVGNAEVIWIIVFLAIFPTLSAFVIQLVAQKYTPPVKVSLILAFEPVFAALFAWTLGQEQFSLHKAMGGFLIFLALIISSLPSRRYRLI